MKRLTFEGNFCDIARCVELPGGSFCEDSACSQRKTWERLKAIEDILGDEYDLDRLREQQARADNPQGQWISVADRLPDNCGNVLAVGFWHEKWNVFVGWYQGHGNWFLATRNGEEKIEVSDWMPLPEPPAMEA